MTDVFVSYDHKDKDRITFLISELERRGVEVWWDRELLAGDQFQRRIQEQIQKSSTVLVLWTERAIQSDWVRAEAMLGFDRRSLISVCLDQVDVPIPFNIQSVVSLVDWPHKSSQAEMNRLVQQVVEKTSLADSTSASVEPAVEENLSVRLARRVVKAIGVRKLPMRLHLAKSRLRADASIAYLEATALTNQMNLETLDEAWNRLQVSGNGVMIQELRVEICAARVLLGDHRATTDYRAMLSAEGFEEDLPHLASLAVLQLAGTEASLNKQLQMADDRSVFHYAVWVLVPLGEDDLARRFLELAVQASPGDSMIRFRLALLIARSGDLTRAMEEIETCRLIAAQSPLYRFLQAILLGSQGSADQSDRTVNLLDQWQHPLTEALHEQAPSELLELLELHLLSANHCDYIPRQADTLYKQIQVNLNNLKGTDWHQQVKETATQFLEQE